MPVPPAYANSLPIITLDELMGFLETVEGFGIPQGNRNVYADESGNPTIGYGFLLYKIATKSTAPTDGLMATLDQITNSAGNNIFSVSTMSAADIGAYFVSLLSANFANSSSLNSLLSWAISDLFAGITLVNGQPPPMTPGQSPSVSFSLTPKQAGRALFNLIEGGQIANGQTPITGESPLTYAQLSNLLNLTNGQNITGAAPGTSQWEALVALKFNGLPSALASTIATGLTSNPALSWYAFRYLDWSTLANGLTSSGHQTRNYLQSGLYGLNGGVTVSGSAQVFAQAEQDYQVLSQYRTNIVPAERLFGADPDGLTPEKTPIYVTDSNGNIVLGPNNKSMKTALFNANYDAARMGSNYAYPSGPDTIPASGSHGAVAVAPTTPVVLSNTNLTLAATFDPEANAVKQYLNSTYSLLPTLYVDTMGGADTASGPMYDVRSTDIFAASIGDSVVDAAVGDGDRFNEAARNHILLGTSTAETLIGGLGNDILVGGTGNERLQAGAGLDTIIGGQGNETLLGGNENTVFDVEFSNNPNPTGSTETIVSRNGGGALYINGGEIGRITSTHTVDQWTDGTYNYQFIKGTNLSQAQLQGLNVDPASFGPAVGELQITSASMSNTTVGTVDLIGFNLQQAELSGYLGVNMGSSDYLNFTANQGVDPTDPGFVQGANQSFTLSVDAPSSTAQSFTVTLSGAISSDFEAVVGGSTEQLTSNGTFNVALAAGQTNVAFTLEDVTANNGATDISSGATLTLSASLPNADTLVGGVSETAPLTFNYVPTNTAAASQPSDQLVGTNEGGTYLYTGDGNDDYVSAAGPKDDIELQTSGNDSIIGGTGQNTIYAGGGNSTVVGSNATDIIVAGNGNNQIFSGSQTTLQNAIAQAAVETPSGVQGNYLAVQDGNNTIVGGTGNDLITAGAGDDVIVLGPGHDAFIGGWETESVNSTWNFSIGTGVAINGNQVSFEDNIGSFAQPYNGGYQTLGPISESGPANDTIYGGTGNDYIGLGNGSNYVDVGSGNTTVYGGMGSDTIIAGSGNDLIADGGGTNYISGGSGTDTIFGGDGSNTIIGGSGNSTIYSSTFYDTSTGSHDLTFTNGNLDQNYVTGGSGNDVIYGSGGQDTLIAGTGNSTIYGESGNENITGGSGNDLLVGGSGNVTISAGGGGADTLQGSSGTTSTTIIYGGSGSETIQAVAGTNILYAGDGGTASAPTYVYANQSDATSQTTIYGGLGVDSLTGGAGNTVIYAGDGGTSAAPTLAYAYTGNTTIYGGLGTDVIQGNSGTDVLYAGGSITAFDSRHQAFNASSSNSWLSCRATSL